MPGFCLFHVMVYRIAFMAFGNVPVGTNFWLWLEESWLVEWVEMCVFYKTVLQGLDVRKH